MKQQHVLKRDKNIYFLFRYVMEIMKRQESKQFDQSL
jgi:hypothetical protein